MKTLLSENSGYKIYVHLRNFNNNSENVELKITSTYDSSKNPNEEQTKFAIILTPEQRQILKSLL